MEIELVLKTKLSDGNKTVPANRLVITALRYSADVTEWESDEL